MTKLTTNNKSMRWLLVSVLLDHTSINIVFPVLTLICFDRASALFAPETSLAVRGMWYGLVISVYHLGEIIAAPTLGMVSDYVGRRLLLLVGAIGVILMASLASISLLWGAVSVLVLGRLLGGLCAVKGVTQAAVGDLPSIEAKLVTMGYLQAAIAIGALLGPLLGGYMASHFFSAQFNFSAPFWLAATIGLASLIIVYFKVPETLAQRTPLSWWSVLKSIRTLLLKPVVFRISLLLFLSQVSWSLYYQYMPPFLKNAVGLSATEVGLFLSLIALWLALAASFCIKFLQKRLPLKQIVQLASWIMLAGILLTLMAVNLPHPTYQQGLVWLASMPVAAGDVIAYVAFTTLYSNIAKESQQGLAMGICLIIAQLVWFLTGLLGGMLVGIHILLPLWISPLGIIILLLLLSVRPAWLGGSSS